MKIAEVPSSGCGYAVLSPEAALPADPQVAGGQTGFIHSIESGSAVDGPGLRAVVFLAGCLLRCQFCHNPDTWHRDPAGGVSLDAMVAQLAAYAPFLRTCKGGITLSGGEPLVQLPFAMNLLKRCREELGLHTAVQTAAFLGDRVTDEMLGNVDLWMVDIKSADAAAYERVTAVQQAPMVRFIRRLAERGRPAWATYVLVPGLTDSDDQLDALGEMLAPLSNLTRVEIRPFHQLGKAKWQVLGLPYPLEQTQPPTAEQTAHAVAKLAAFGLPVAVA